MEQGEQKKNMQKVAAKAAIDEGFKQRLLADSTAVLKEEGVEIPPGIEVRIVENSDKVFHFILPQKPSNEELSDEQLDAAAGGNTIGDPLSRGDSPDEMGDTFPRLS